MTTAIQMISDALRLANVIDETETPSPEMGAAALRTMNQLAGQWHRDGIKIGWQQVATQATTLPIDYQDERAVKYNLAVELAGEYGIEPVPRVTKIASDTYAALAKAHGLQVESDLSLLPESEPYWGGGSIQTG